MIENSTADNDKLGKIWAAQIQSLWPAIKGSLAQVRKPCIRQNCQACASGKKHPAWMLSVVAGGRRSTLYVPEALVGPIKQAIKNGRKIESLLQKAAIQMVKNHRSQIKKTKKQILKS